jgi:hypothetical protein
VTPRSTIFISAVNKELESACQLVSNTLQSLGEPVWQDIFGTERGDLHATLGHQIDESRNLLDLQSGLVRVLPDEATRWIAGQVPTPDVRQLHPLAAQSRRNQARLAVA